MAYKITELTLLLSSADAQARATAAGDLGRASDRYDISVVVPALVRLLSDEDDRVRVAAAGALNMAALNGRDISFAVPALAKALLDEDIGVRWNADNALGNAADEGTDISAVVPTLMKALSDDDKEVRERASYGLNIVAEKMAIDLQEVKKALALFVKKEGKKGTKERKTAEKEATGYYLRIASAESKRRKSIDMDGLLLDEKPKPPEGPKTYRKKVAT